MRLCLEPAMAVHTFSPDTQRQRQVVYTASSRTAQDFKEKPCLKKPGGGEGGGLIARLIDDWNRASMKVEELVAFHHLCTMVSFLIIGHVFNPLAKPSLRDNLFNLE